MLKQLKLTLTVAVPEEAITTWDYGTVQKYVKTQLHEAVETQWIA